MGYETENGKSVEQITRGERCREATRPRVALTKQMFQGHAVDARCRVMTSRALRRDQFLPWCAQLPSACLVAMEASPSAHHRARQLQAMGLDAHILSAQLAAPNRMHGHNVHATGMGPR